MPKSKTTATKGSASPSKPTMPTPKCPELEALKAACKGKNALCTPMIDKSGAWTWRGKELERVWDAIFAGAEGVEKHTPADEGVGSFAERYEATSGDIRVYAGTCRGGTDEGGTFNVSYAVIFGAGRVGDTTAVQRVLELPTPLAFVSVHLLATMHKVLFTQEKVLALLSAKAESARADVNECIAWMRDRLAAVERSPQAILTRCVELQKTAKEMHAHYLKQVVSRLGAKERAERQTELDALQQEGVEEGAAEAGAGAAEASSPKAPEEVLTEPDASSGTSGDPSPAHSPKDMADARQEPPEAEEDEEEEDDDDDDDDEEEHPTLAERSLGLAQRELAEAAETHRQAKAAFERAEVALATAQQRVFSAREAVDAEEETRATRRREARKARLAARPPKASKPPARKPTAAEARASGVQQILEQQASGGSGARAALTGASKEAREVADVARYDVDVPAALAASLVTLRTLGAACPVPTEALPFDVLAFLVAADVVVQCAEAPEGSGAKGRWFVAIGSSECTPDGHLHGAVGWFDLGCLPTSLDGALLTAEALPPPRRAVALDDKGWEPSSFMHTTVQGYGEEGRSITPMGYSLFGHSALHMAAAMAHFHVASAQMSARFGHNRASAQERAHAEQLMDAARERMAECARLGEADKWVAPTDLSRCESAVQGLRKTLLRRPWNPRCESCGVRHEDIEFSTCRFWQAWVV